MKIFLSQKKDTDIFEVSNEKGFKHFISSDGPAVSPMQTVLMAAASCSTVDIIHILNKMRQPLEDIKTAVEGFRRDEIPKVFTRIHLHYSVTGDLKENKVKQAVDLSLNKYCSVTQMLQASVEITSSYEIISKL